MMMLRRQLVMLVFFSLVAITYLAWQAKTANAELQALQDSVTQSLTLEATAWRWISIRPQVDELRSNRIVMEKLEPEARRAAFRRVFLAFEENSNLKSRVEFFQRSEKEYRRFQTGRIQFLHQHVSFMALCSVSVMLGSFVVMTFYFRHQVFSPIHALSRKMTDFLNNRYTYQFTVPAANELGHLQATFNSLAQRVLRNMEELTSLDHAKSEFLSIASHELRTPLTSIKGSLSLMKSGVVGTMNEMSVNLLNIAELETDRLIRLINELLDLAKIEAGKFEVHPTWHPVSPLIEKTFQSLSGLAQAADVELTYDAPAPVDALMDADRIQQVLTNLLSNAIKFSPKGSRVDVSLETDSLRGLEICVRDHGRGIAPADQELIFQKFRQATSAKNPLVKGTGLGLAIAKALVEEHGGDIGVRSTPGEGSTFYFTLPQWQYNQRSALNQTQSSEPDSIPGAAA